MLVATIIAVIIDVKVEWFQLFHLEQLNRENTKEKKKDLRPFYYVKKKNNPVIYSMYKFWQVRGTKLPRSGDEYSKLCPLLRILTSS